MISGMFNGAELGPEAYRENVERVQARPDAALDALDALLIQADEVALSSLYPEALLQMLANVVPERVQRASRCVAARYEQAIARREREPVAPSEEARSFLLRLRTHLAAVQGVRPRAMPTTRFCVDAPCGAGEVCVHPCCTGPCDPGAPYCVKLPKDTSLAAACPLITTMCPGCVMDGAAAQCHCPPSP